MRWVFVAGNALRTEIFARVLRREGFRVTTLASPLMISEGILARPHDCAVLLELPHQAVIDVAVHISKVPRDPYDTPVPLLALSAPGGNNPVGANNPPVIWVEQDTDDALLLAHMRALIRRRQGYPSHHRFGNLGLDREKSRASLNGQPLELRPMEFNLLSLLIEARGRPIPSTTLSQHLWPEHPYHCGRLAVHVHRLRKRLDGRNTGIRVQYLKSMGYSLSIRAKSTSRLVKHADSAHL